MWALALCGTALAGEPDLAMPSQATSAPIEKPWEFELVPYLWAAGLEGRTGSGDAVSDIDLGFSDLAENLDFAMSALFVAAHRSGWGFFVDGQYVRLDGGGPSGLPELPDPLPKLPDRLDATIESAFFSLAPTCRLIQRENALLNLYGGARIFYSGTELTFSGGDIRNESVKDDYTWVDAIIGLQGRYHLNDRIFLGGMVDVGAGSSDFTWQILGAIGYRFTDHIDARIAYRYMMVDYTNSDFVYDIEMQGLALGLGIHW